MNLLSYSKQVLTWIGEHLSRAQLTKIQATLNYLYTGRWMKDRDYRPAHRVRDREAVWRAGIALLGQEKILYLEFGVAAGDSLDFWSRNFTNPNARLHGFDSFVGMPENGGPWRQGQFDMKGKLPSIADSRIKIFPGWFNDSLPSYVVPPHDTLVLNMDADLFSSTIYVLRYFKDFFRAGTLIYFDEMNHPEHEPRAFDDFIKETGLRFRLVSADRSLAHQLYVCDGR